MSKKFLKQTEETSDHYDSDIDIEDDGMGQCSKCQKITTCILLNTHEVLCVDSDLEESDRDNETSCSYRSYTWHYLTPKQYMREMRKLREKRAMIENSE